MEVAIKVRKALTDALCKMSIMNTLLIVIIAVFLFSLGMPLLNKWLHPFLLPCIGLVFLYMILEDFLEQSVDMRVWLMLSLCMQLYASFSVQFYMDSIVGMILFFMLFSFSWKKIEEPQNKDCDNGNKLAQLASQCHFGLLPSLGIALIAGNLLPVPAPMVEFGTVYDAISHHPSFISGCIAIFIVACYRQYKLYALLRQGQSVQFGMGAGDCWVCGAWFAFLGAATFSFVFFLALWIQLLLYSVNYFCQKSGEFNENK